MIEIQQLASGDPAIFRVTIRDARGESRHRVSLNSQTLERLAPPGTPPECLVDAAFRYLLEREPRDSILPSFDIQAISLFFPAFERDIGHYIAQH
ncbi:MAG: hypothetical protein D6786_09960 [Gammaproteobacteria bacterium]|nr:MAG: hypothetical protein D6786_09960 [Gammaproteobacteria bacterium]